MTGISSISEPSPARTPLVIFFLNLDNFFYYSCDGGAHVYQRATL